MRVAIAQLRFCGSVEPGHKFVETRDLVVGDGPECLGQSRQRVYAVHRGGFEQGGRPIAL